MKQSAETGSHRQNAETPDVFARMLAQLPCGVVRCDGDGRLQYANPALLDMLGGSAESLLHSPVDRCLFADPADYRRFRKCIGRDQRIDDFETEFRCRDGRTLPVRLIASVFSNACGTTGGWQSVVIDRRRQAEREQSLLENQRRLEEKLIGYEGLLIDNYSRRQMERELARTKDLLEEIIQSSPNVILVTDLEGRVIMMNRVAEKVVGCRASEACGSLSVETLFISDVVNRVRALPHATAADGTAAGRLDAFPAVLHCLGGRAVEGNLAASIVTDRVGRRIACVHVFTDLTELLQTERKLRRTQMQLVQSEKLASMGRLTSQIAHELNNPLYGIMNALELLQSEIPMGHRRRKVLEMALSEIVRVTDLLRKMLSFSKPGQQEKTALDINAFLEEILILLAKQLQESNIRVVLDLMPSILPVAAAPDQLRQVFLNLIANAREAMAGGGVLQLRTMEDKGRICIEVSDTGVGIPVEEQNRIFDMFYTTKGHVKGVGLGLSVCYGLVREHHGEIRIQSRPGDGSTFRVLLPIHPDVSPPNSASPSNP